MKQTALPYGEYSPAAGLHPGMLDSILAGAQAILRRWRERAAQRRRLAGLSSRQLDDIGITEAERLEECSKPFWRA